MLAWKKIKTQVAQCPAKKHDLHNHFSSTKVKGFTTENSFNIVSFIFSMNSFFLVKINYKSTKITPKNNEYTHKKTSPEMALTTYSQERSSFLTVCCIHRSQTESYFCFSVLAGNTQLKARGAALFMVQN